MRGTAIRGAALPETVLVLGILLMVIFGTLRMGIIGFQAVSIDGTAFLASHESALGVADAASSATKVYSAGSSAVITQANGTPPTVQIPVQYGFDQSDNRHGGTAVLQPVQSLTTVTKAGIDAPLPLGGGSGGVTVVGASVDPAFREIGAHDNIMGDDFNSLGAFNNAQDYFAAGENTPPYFVGFHYMQYCESDDNTPWHNCPSSDWAALGMAEFLDADNWNCKSGGVGKHGAFADLLEHQRVFANISAAVAGATDALSAKAVLNHQNEDVQTVYSWDSHQPGGYPNGYTHIGQYPLHPGEPC